MKQLKIIDKNFSTTGLCYKLLDESYLDERGRIKEELKFKINLPELGIRDSKIPKQGEEKFDTYLFLPEGEGRQGEGGLRTRGYFKLTYEIENDRWYACDFRGRRLFEVEPPEGFSLDLEEFRAKDGVVRLPLVSIVTIVLNGEKYLKETIKSVINQTYPNVEYIIIDGGSTDGTVDIIKKYEDFIDYWVSEPDNGMYNAINKGFFLARGEILAWLNSDDFYNRGAIECVVKAFSNYSAVKWLTGIPALYDEKDVIIRVSPPKTYFRKLIQLGLYRGDILGWLQQESMFWRRELWKKVHLIDERFKLAGDYYLWIEFAKYAHLYTLQTVLSGFRIHGNRKDNRAFFEKYYAECEKIKTIGFWKLIRIIKPLIDILSVILPIKKISLKV